MTFHMEDEIAHCARWIHYSKELKDLHERQCRMIASMQACIDDPDAESKERKMEQLKYEMECVETNQRFWLGCLEGKTVNDDKFRLCRDLLKGRTVIHHDIDEIQDLAGGHLFPQYFTTGSVEGKATVVQTKDGPRMINKTFDLPFMFYDHVGADKVEENMDEDGTLHAFYIRLNPNLMPRDMV